MESDTYLRFVLVLILVIGLILLLSWVLRRFGFGNVIRPGARRRLHVVETAAAGPRHRLLLIRRDEVEHLLLLGPTGDLLVESGIGGVPAKPVESGVTRSPTFDLALARGDAPTLRAERRPRDDEPTA